MANRKTPRLRAGERLKQLTDVAYGIACKKGISAVTRGEVARVAKVTEPLVTHYFGGTDAMQSVVIEHAAEQKNAGVIASAVRAGWDVSGVTMTREMQREVKRLAADA